jgi:hypothetical protein
MTDTGSKAVTEKVAYQSGLTIDDLQGAFVAVGDTEAAAIAFLFVNLNDLS